MIGMYIRKFHSLKHRGGERKPVNIREDKKAVQEREQKEEKEEKEKEKGENQ